MSVNKFMDVESAIPGGMATIIGTVGAAYIVGSVAYVINGMKEMISSVGEKSEIGANAIRNEIKQLMSEQQQLRKDDRDAAAGAIARLDAADESRRQDVRILFEKNLNLLERIHLSETNRLNELVSDLKSKLK